MLALKYLPTTIEKQGWDAQLKLTPSVLELDLPEVEKRIRRFIKEYVEKAGADGIVLGLSGGIDSMTQSLLQKNSV
jgi:hypothetical protein